MYSFIYRVINKDNNYKLESTWLGNKKFYPIKKINFFNYFNFLQNNYILLNNS